MLCENRFRKIFTSTCKNENKQRVECIGEENDTVWTRACCQTNILCLNVVPVLFQVQVASTDSINTDPNHFSWTLSLK